MRRLHHIASISSLHAKLDFDVFFFFMKDVISSDEKVSTGEEGAEEEEGSQSDNHPDLGRLYFSLRYDEHR